MQQLVIFSAFLIENQDVIEKLEQNEAESQRIGTITLFEFAKQHLLFMVHLEVLVYSIPVSRNIKPTVLQRHIPYGFSAKNSGGPIYLIVTVHHNK